jgi:acyl-CoA synthetase (AMP-forming)/AMP-acid ligase II
MQQVLLPPEESKAWTGKKSLRESGEKFCNTIEMSFQVIDILQEASAVWKDQEAAIHRDTAISYAELLEQVNVLATLIRKKMHGDGKGIALLCANNFNFPRGLFAASAAGFVVMPVWISLTPAEIQASLSEAGINILMAEKNPDLHFNSSVKKETLDDEFSLFYFSELPSEPVSKRFPGAAFIRPSSGTTGASKGVVITHQAVLERINAGNEGLKLSSQDKVTWVLPMAFHFIVSICLYIKTGTCIVISDDFLPETIISVSNKHGASVLYASPLHYQLLARSQSRDTFQSLKKAYCTSAGIDTDTIRSFKAKFSIPLYQAFGIIEAGLPIINNAEDDSKAASTGRVISPYEIKIFDDEMNEAGRDQAGQLAIKGPGMFSGYLWPFTPAEKVLHHSWFLTGDIARMDEEGFVYIQGRKKSLINISGTKIFPEEVEQVLIQHPGIDDVRVFSGKHALTGEFVQAEVVMSKDSCLTFEDIVSFCRQYLAPAKIPKRIDFVEHIHKTNTGKTIRS